MLSLKINMKKELKHPVARHRWTLGQRIADRVTNLTGTWIFIILLFIFLLIWVGINFYELVEKFDPYPFVFLNLVLAVINTILAPIILMSQKRQSERGTLKAEYEYEISKKSEREIGEIQKQLNRIEKKLG